MRFLLASMVVVFVACVGNDPDSGATPPANDAGSSGGGDATPSNDGAPSDPDSGVDAGPPPPTPENKTTFAYWLGTHGTEATPVAVGGDGYVVAAHNYIEQPPDLPASNNANAIAIVLLAPDGKPVWTKGVVPAKTGANFNPAGIAFDATGDIYLAGTSNSAADFGGGATIPTSSPDYGFLVKLRRSDGQGVFTKTFVSSVGASVTALALRGDTVAIAGTFYTKVTLQKTDDSSLDVTGGGSGIPMFVASLDRASGKARWAKSASAVVTSGPPTASPSGVGVDDAGNVYVGGSFRGTLSGLGADLVMVGDESNGFVASLAAANGDPRWGKRFGSATATSGARVLSLAATTKTVAVGGQVPAATDFGDGKAIGTTGATDAFIATYGASDGAAKWSVVVGGDDGAYDSEKIGGVAIDAWEQVVGVGDYRKVFNVAGNTLPKPPDIGGDPNNPSTAFFGMKVDATGKQVWGKAITSSTFASARAVAAHASGTFAVGLVVQGTNIDLGAGKVVSTATYNKDLAVLGWTP